MSFSQTPAYNLKVVLKETGIKADVLRAWERRYGLPLPQRSAGGHRLYSQQDVETIKWLLARQNEGLAISRAVDLWREIESGGRDPLAEVRQAASPAGSALPGAQASLDALRNEWVQGCLAYNENFAEQALNQAFALYPAETVCVDVLQKGLVDVGALWYENRATVQQEHFASGLAMRRLDALLAAAPHPTRAETVLVGCPPGEWHVFTALLLALFLRRRGINVIYLGADVPAMRFEETVTAVRANLVVLVAQQLITAAGLQQVAAVLTARGAHVGYGGRIFSIQPSLSTHISGYFLGADLEGAVNRIDSLLADGADIEKPNLPGPEYVTALGAFLARRSIIEASLDENAAALRLPLEYLYTANQFLGDNIVAALRLGEMAYLDAEINWLKAFLHGYRLPSGMLGDYFKTYLNVVRRHLNDAGAPIVAWLERQLAEIKNLQD